MASPETRLSAASPRTGFSQNGEASGSAGVPTFAVDVVESTVTPRLPSGMDCAYAQMSRMTVHGSAYTYGPRPP